MPTPHRLAALVATQLLVAASLLVLGADRAVADGPGSLVATAAGPAGGEVLRYRSVGARGELTEQTGAMWVPAGTPSGAVVAWAHPTTGLGDQCAPSRDDDVDVPALEALLAAGHVVVAPDYEGLRGEGVHPYLVGESAGRSVLDAVRAARSHAGVDGPVAVYGWSQGGHAALYAGVLAPDYAPELDVRGVVALAPVTDVAALVDGRSPFAQVPGFVALVAVGYGTAYDDLDAADLLGDRSDELEAVVREGCADDAVEALADTSTRQPDGRWQGRLRANDPSGFPLDVPALLVHGEDDGLLPVEATARARARWCGAGADVGLHRAAGLGHAEVARGTSSVWLGWLEDRLAGDPVAHGCRSPVPA